MMCVTGDLHPDYFHGTVEAETMLSARGEEMQSVHVGTLPIM